jgi:nitrilase
MTARISGPDQTLMITHRCATVSIMPAAKIAAIQAAPVFLDRETTIEKMGTLAKEAAANGAVLTVLPEAFVPTYQDFAWRTTPWADGDWYARFADQSVDVPRPACDAIAAIGCRAATR